MPRSGQYVRLEPLDADRHAEALWAASHGSAAREAVWRYLPYGPWASADALGEFLRQMPAPDLLPFVVVRLDTGTPVGTTSLCSLAPEHGRAEIGHVWMSADVQRTKINTEAQYLLLRHLFDDKQYRRVEWKCNADNAQSRHAAARMGFQFEGRFRQHMWRKGRNRDTDWFALVDKDWPRVGANFRKWLYEDDRVGLGELNSG